MHMKFIGDLLMDGTTALYLFDGCLVALMLTSMGLGEAAKFIWKQVQRIYRACRFK